MTTAASVSGPRAREWVSSAFRVLQARADDVESALALVLSPGEIPGFLERVRVTLGTASWALDNDSPARALDALVVAELHVAQVERLADSLRSTGRGT